MNPLSQPLSFSLPIAPSSGATGQQTVAPTMSSPFNVGASDKWSQWILIAGLVLVAINLAKRGF